MSNPFPPPPPPPPGGGSGVPPVPGSGWQPPHPPMPAVQAARPMLPAALPPVATPLWLQLGIVGFVVVSVGVLLVPGIGETLARDAGWGALYTLTVLLVAIGLLLLASRRSFGIRERQPAETGSPGTVAQPVPGSAQAYWQDGYPVQLTDPRVYPAAPITLREAIAHEVGGGRPVGATGWGMGDVGIVFGGWFMLSLIAGFVVAFGEQAKLTGGLRDSLTLLAVALPWIAMAGWPLLVTKLRGNGPKIDLGLRWSWRDIGWGLLYGVAAFITAALLGALTAGLYGDFSSSAGDLSEDLADNVLILLLFSLTVAIGAPIVEEICFRGMLFNAAAKRGLMPWITVVLTALIFAAFHLEAIRMLLLMGIALVLGLARWHTGSTTTTIVAHMVNNLPGALFLLFGTS